MTKQKIFFSVRSGRDGVSLEDHMYTRANDLGKFIQNQRTLERSHGLI